MSAKLWRCTVSLRPFAVIYPARASGDGPAICPLISLWARVAPRARGWTRAQCEISSARWGSPRGRWDGPGKGALPRRPGAASPAHAGMDGPDERQLVVTVTCCSRSSVPHSNARVSSSASDNGRSVNLPDHVRRLYAGLETGRATDSLLRQLPTPQSARPSAFLRVTAAGSLSRLPAFRPIVLHPARDRLLFLG